jgi:hypothetical protein
VHQTRPEILAATAQPGQSSYELIICTAREMDAIWRYIENNPAIWNDDNENPTRHP